MNWFGIGSLYLFPRPEPLLAPRPTFKIMKYKSTGVFFLDWWKLVRKGVIICMCSRVHIYLYMYIQYMIGGRGGGKLKYVLYCIPKTHTPESD